MLAIVPVLVVIYIVTTIFTSIFSTNLLEEQVRENAKLLSHSYSKQLDSTIEEYFNVGQDLGNAVITSINVETTLQVFIRRYSQFTNVFYTPADGKVFHMAPYRSEFMNFDLSSMNAWRYAYENKLPAVSEPGVYFGRKAVIFFAPAMLAYVLNQEPTVEGIVAMVLPLDELFTHISGVSIGESGSIFVIDGKSRFLYHNDSSLILDSGLEQSPDYAAMEPIVRAMKEQKRGFGTYEGDKGRNYIAFSPVPSARWSLGVYDSYSQINARVSGLVLINLLIMLAGVVAGAVLMYYVVHSVVIPIEQLTEMAKKVSKGDRTVTTDLKTSSEVGVLSRSINIMVSELRDNQRKLEATVEERTMELQRTNEELAQTVEELNASNSTLQRTRDALWTEMELAHKLQTVLLPEKPAIDGYEVAAFVETTETVGGDYFDVIHAEGRDWFLIGDVSGHGVNSGLIMMMVQTSIHVALSQNPTIDPSDLLTIINKTIHNNIHKLGEQRYMTLTVFACHDHGRFLFSGAHLPLICYKKDTGMLEVTETNGTWIGIVDDISGMNDNEPFSLEEGDSLLLYTDGITESVRKSGGDFTQKDLGNLFAELAFLPVDDIVKGIRKEMKNLVFDDDVTIFVVKRVEK